MSGLDARQVGRRTDEANTASTSKNGKIALPVTAERLYGHDGHSERSSSYQRDRSSWVVRIGYSLLPGPVRDHETCWIRRSLMACRKISLITFDEHCSEQLTSTKRSQRRIVHYCGLDSVHADSISGSISSKLWKLHKRCLKASNAKAVKALIRSRSLWNVPRDARTWNILSASFESTSTACLLDLSHVSSFFTSIPDCLSFVS
jgi:hypothetical protein